MLPNVEYDIVSDLNVDEVQPSFTYGMDTENLRVVGKKDNLEAVKQAIYKVINTERYENLIYSWNYGVELKDLYGMPINYVVPEIERRITEALLQDDRVQNVYGFSFAFPKKGVVKCTFNVTTADGEIMAEKEVNF